MTDYTSRIPTVLLLLRVSIFELRRFAESGTYIHPTFGRSGDCGGRRKQRDGRWLWIIDQRSIVAG